MTRLVDYYAILNVSTTASLGDIQRALGAASERLAQGAAAGADRDEALRLLSRARTVLCDDQNRMMYDILGEDVTANEPAAPPAPLVFSPPPIPQAEEVSADILPIDPVPAQPMTQSQRAAEAEYKRLCAELEWKARRLRAADGRVKKSFISTRMGRVLITLCVSIIFTSLSYFVVEFFFR